MKNRNEEKQKNNRVAFNSLQLSSHVDSKEPREVLAFTKNNTYALYLSCLKCIFMIIAAVSNNIVYMLYINNKILY